MLSVRRYPLLLEGKVESLYREDSVDFMGLLCFKDTNAKLREVTTEEIIGYINPQSQIGSGIMLSRCFHL